MLSLSRISKSFASLAILRDISFTVEHGASLAIVGPSGSGKTTLLSIVSGLLVPDSGTVSIDGANPYALSESERVEFRRRTLGLVFQQHRLLPQLTALENVVLPTLAGKRRATSEDMERARALLSDVGLAERATHRPGQLSGGECQRIAVARALMNAPALLVADEPTASLDRATADEMGGILLDLAARHGTTLLAATHDTLLAARFTATLELQTVHK